jgi:hypothetical protein
MEFREFIDRDEVYQRKWENQWRHTRLIVGALTHSDPREIIRLPGDYDNIPKLMSQEESKKLLSMHGIDKLLMSLSKRGSC